MPSSRPQTDASARTHSSSGARPGPTVVVVGAGISGLAAGHELLRLRPDLHVVVLDSADQVGGKLALLEIGDLTVDAGAEALLARRPEATDLARAVGLEADLVTPTTTAARVWSRGRLEALPPGTLMGIPAWTRHATGLLTEHEAAWIDAEPGRPVEPVDDDVDVASYVAGRVGPAVVDRLVEPLLGGVYAGHASRLSLQATVPAAWAAAHAGRSLVEAARAQSARPQPPPASPSGPSSASPSASPAAPPAGPPPVFAGIRGGVGRLPIAVRSALERLGGEVRTGVTVRELRRAAAPGRGGWELVTGSTTDPVVVRADAVVLAVPARPASRLLAMACPGASTRLAGVDAASMAVVTAVVPGAAALVAQAGSGFLVPPVEGRLVKASTFSSAKWGWLGDAAGDDLVVRLSIGRQGEEADLQRGDAELTSAALAELGLALGADLPAPLATAVVRWGGGLPQYAVGHVPLMAAVRAEVGTVPGLALCGAYLDGLGVPACIAAAQRAAAEVLADLPVAGPDERRTMAS